MPRANFSHRLQVKRWCAGQVATNLPCFAGARTSGADCTYCGWASTPDGDQRDLVDLGYDRVHLGQHVRAVLQRDLCADETGAASVPKILGMTNMRSQGGADILSAG